MCPNHRLVPCRMLDFAMTEDPNLPGNIVRAHAPGPQDGQVIIGRTDGLGCPACGSFEPNEKPNA